MAEVKVKEVVTKTITLELTEKEAQVLMACVGSIYGSSDKSARKIATEIWDKMHAQNIHYYKKGSGGITFPDDVPYLEG